MNPTHDQKPFQDSSAVAISPPFTCEEVLLYEQWLNRTNDSSVQLPNSLHIRLAFGSVQDFDQFAKSDVHIFKFFQHFKGVHIDLTTTPTLISSINRIIELLPTDSFLSLRLPLSPWLNSLSCSSLDRIAFIHLPASTDDSLLYHTRMLHDLHFAKCTTSQTAYSLYYNTLKFNDLQHIIAIDLLSLDLTSTNPSNDLTARPVSGTDSGNASDRKACAIQFFFEGNDKCNTSKTLNRRRATGFQDIDPAVRLSLENLREGHYLKASSKAWGCGILFFSWLMFICGSLCMLWPLPSQSIEEYEEQSGFPIHMYYPSLAALACVMLWVWCVMSWMGMKFFGHAKVARE